MFCKGTTIADHLERGFSHSIELEQPRQWFRNWLDIFPRATLLHPASFEYDGTLFEKQARGGWVGLPANLTTDQYVDIIGQWFYRKEMEL